MMKKRWFNYKFQPFGNPHGDIHIYMGELNWQQFFKKKTGSDAKSI
jgi:hypothetical protein